MESEHMLLLCRNKVRDFDQWKRVFVSHRDAHRAAGLVLVSFWRSIDDVKDVFFLFEIDDRENAESFMNAPDATVAANEAGVIAGDYHFLRATDGY
jgi:hypothetical protein